MEIRASGLISVADHGVGTRIMRGTVESGCPPGSSTRQQNFMHVECLVQQHVPKSGIFDRNTALTLSDCDAGLRACCTSDAHMGMFLHLIAWVGIRAHV